MNPGQLIHRYLSGEATEAEVSELNRLLAETPSLRKDFLFESSLDSSLRELALERLAGPNPSEAVSISPIFRPVAWFATAAAIILMATLLYSHFSKPEVIATLISGENASWESSLPTVPGSDLSAGFLNLTSGIATIRFRSGAEVTLEAPAKLILETAMRGKLLSGSAVIDVPEPAIGFIIETPNGYAVDHGTQFSVSVDNTIGKSDFEVLKGEISVHLPTTGEEVRLGDRKSASILNHSLQTYDGPLPPRQVKTTRRVMKVKTRGRSTSIVKNNKRQDHLHPDLLMVQNVNGGPLERRALISFDVSKVDLAAVKSVKLGMKMLPSGIGFASHLPVKNIFSVYGVIDTAKEDWAMDCLWEDAPTPENGVFLGSVKVNRSRQDKYCSITNENLLNFLKADANGVVTMIIVRETEQIDNTRPGLVHAFATDSHPEASGPSLRFSFSD